MGRILFVDDEPRVLDGYRRSLMTQDLDGELAFANGALEAISTIEAEPVDVVVSDVMMPGIDGFELLRRIRERAEWEHLPVIIVTGLNERELKSEALRQGATDLLSKPVATADLVARLRSAITIKQYHDELRDRNRILEDQVRERTREIEESRAEVVFRLAKAAELRDEDTGLHVVRVACYCRVLATALGLSDAARESIFLASPLHDVGKIGIPDRILLKPGKLDPDEWAVMQTHATIGAAILGPSPGAFSKLIELWLGPEADEARQAGNPILEAAAEIAAAHHEKWNGGGYPAGLAGEAIPLPARICAVADVYDALSSERPYKAAFPEEKVLGIMAEGAGSHFDPAVHDAFIRSLDELRGIRQEFQEPARVPSPSG